MSYEGRDEQKADDDYKVFAGNVDYSVDERDLRHLFEKYGRVVNVQIAMDRETNRPRGFAFITYEDKASVDKAIDKMHGYELNGRALTVNRARGRSDRDDRGRGGDRYGGGGYDRGGRDYDRDGYRGGGGGYDRGGSRSGGYDSGYRERPRKEQGYRVKITGLPTDYTWRELKDFLRTAGRVEVTYANVDNPGSGVGEFPTIEERETAVKNLDGTLVEGQRVYLEEMERPPGGYPAPARRDYDRGGYNDRGGGYSDRGGGYGDRGGSQRGGGGGYSSQGGGYDQGYDRDRGHSRGGDSYSRQGGGGGSYRDSSSKGGYEGGYSKGGSYEGGYSKGGGYEGGYSKGGGRSEGYEGGRSGGYEGGRSGGYEGGRSGDYDSYGGEGGRGGADRSHQSRGGAGGSGGYDRSAPY